MDYISYFNSIQMQDFMYDEIAMYSVCANRPTYGKQAENLKYCVIMTFPWAGSSTFALLLLV